MKTKTSFWQRMGFHEWFLKREATYNVKQTQPLTAADVYKYIVQRFEDSIKELSFANRVVFFHEYIVCFNEDDYNQFAQNKKGIFGLIVQECIKQFYNILERCHNEGKIVAPASNKWVFRFAAHPEYLPGDKSVIGKLMPGSLQQKKESVRVTFIPRQTGIAETFDVNPELLDGFIFYSDGYYEIAYNPHFRMQDTVVKNGAPKLLARFETIVPDKEFAGKKIEYYMREPDVLISGKDEAADKEDIFRIPSEWVNTPHLRVKFNKDDHKFYLASFGEKTLVNENEVVASDMDNPVWVPLPLNSRIVLNGIVGVNIFKS
ncbi:hypothetical protein [Parafilimonas sp.]|uniref:hypothetical protein n=1 Tax=Parafilimonas sp. TaxID=1969739 RepID=UPI0039E41906